MLLRHSRPPYVPSHSQYVPFPDGADGSDPWWFTWFRLTVVLPVLVVLVIGAALVISTAFTTADQLPRHPIATPTTYEPPMGDGSGQCFDVICNYRAGR